MQGRPPKRLANKWEALKCLRCRVISAVSLWRCSCNVALRDCRVHWPDSVRTAAIGAVPQQQQQQQRQGRRKFAKGSTFCPSVPPNEHQSAQRALLRMSSEAVTQPSASSEPSGGQVGPHYPSLQALTPDDAADAGASSAAASATESASATASAMCHQSRGRPAPFISPAFARPAKKLRTTIATATPEFATEAAPDATTGGWMSLMLRCPREHCGAELSRLRPPARDTCKGWET